MVLASQMSTQSGQLSSPSHLAEEYPMSIDARLAHSITVQRMRRADLEDAHESDGGIVQVSMIEALLDGCYDGDVTVAELAGHGDFGLGTLEGLDGELVVVDGEFWNINYDGVARRAPESAGVPFAALVNFEAAQHFHISGPMAMAALHEELLRHFPDPDACYALRLEGSFGPVTFRSVARQEPPYRPLAEVIATDEKQFTVDHLTGTIVGFHFPDMAAEMNQPGFHFHMVTADRTTGGHVYDVTVQDVEVTVGVSHSVHVELPERNLAEVLTLDDTLRRTHLHLVRTGSTTAADTAVALGVGDDDAADALRRLANRGMADPVGDTGVYRPHLARHRTSQLPPALDDL
jgi:acetolactate decarboxylase